VKQKVITPGFNVSGSLLVPASKSHSQRALACAMLNTKQTKLYGVGLSDDEQAVLQIIRDCGARVKINGDHYIIHGVEISNIEPANLSIGESGLASRMLTPIMALSKNKISIYGHGSILQRPMNFFESTLPQVGVDIQSKEGKLPIIVQGPLKPKDIIVDGSLSSQFITGLILAYVGSPLTKNESITIENPTSIPYINLTIQTLREFGHNIKFETNKITFEGPYTFKDTELKIEGDWSSAAFFMVAAALFGTIDFKNLKLNSTQADKAILHILESFGAEIKINNEIITVSKKECHSFHFDATHAPDLFPILTVLGAYGSETSSIKGVHRLTHKESNRADAILSEFSKFGAQMKIENDTLYIEPKAHYSGAIIDPHGDHRMVMAATIFALGLKEKTTLLHPEVCAKSFPSFFDALSSIHRIKD
jgi:3-phosphoshikimate 1-carboxyvinyltransferase